MTGSEHVTEDTCQGSVYEVGGSWTKSDVKLVHGQVDYTAAGADCAVFSRVDLGRGQQVIEHVDGHDHDRNEGSNNSVHI